MRRLAARCDHPTILHALQMRFRHLVMAGFKKLGIKVDKDDLVTERQNVLAAAPLRSEAR